MPAACAMAPSSKSKADNILEDLHESVANIFDQAQSSLANHKKNCVALYKIHLKAAEVKQPSKSGTGEKLVGEKAFQDVFIDMVARVLVVKKGPATADRIVKYVGSFVKFMNEKRESKLELVVLSLLDAILKSVNEAKSKAASTSSASTRNGHEAEEDEETSTSRFVSRLLNWLLQGLVAKNKIVRYRCIQTIGEMIAHLGEIEQVEPS